MYHVEVRDIILHYNYHYICLNQQLAFSLKEYLGTYIILSLDSNKVFLGDDSVEHTRVYTVVQVSELKNRASSTNHQEKNPFRCPPTE